jgi:hypothetical protein
MSSTLITLPSAGEMTTFSSGTKSRCGLRKNQMIKNVIKVVRIRSQQIPRKAKKTLIMREKMIKG